MKHSTQKTPGLLLPIVSPRAWHTVTLDFVGGFAPAPNTQHTHCLVIVDKFTKYTILEGVDETVTAEQTAKIFVKRVVAEHRVPSVILSDRGSPVYGETVGRNSVSIWWKGNVDCRPPPTV